LQRIAFQLRIREGMVEEYDKAHRNVWPELMKEMREMGIREYSMFRRGRQLFLYLQTNDWEQVLLGLNASVVNRQWQNTMARLLEPAAGLQAGETFAMLQEVFYMDEVEAERIPESA
jgi:L-rhamnose mutarotase